MPSLIQPEFKKAFYANPKQWLQQQELDRVEELTSTIEPWLVKREHALSDSKALKPESGKLSREIGALKKSGQPADELIAAMKVVKQQQKALDKAAQQAELIIYETIQQHLNKKAEQAKALLKPKVAELNYAELIVEPLTDALRSACIDYVESSPAGTFYHHPECCELIEKSFGHNWQYFVASISGKVVGVLPVVALKSKLFGCFGVSVPFFNYGGPIGEGEEVIKALLSASEQYAHQNNLSHLEHRCLAPLPQYPGHQNKYSMWLPLPSSADELWQAIGSKVRAQVNKAKPHELSVHIGGAELLDDFYRVFAVNMRDLGTPVYAKQFFKTVLDAASAETKIVVLKNTQGLPVSASFLLGYKQRLEVPWASTLRKYNYTNANMQLYWQMLKYACDKGYQTFDFGRSSADASTYKFKKQWGAEPVQLHWHYWLAGGEELPELNPNNPKYRLVIRLWQKMPVWLTKLVGPKIVKSLP